MKKLFIFITYVLFFSGFGCSGSNSSNSNNSFGNDVSNSDTSAQGQCTYVPDDTMQCNPVCNTGCEENEICSFSSGNFTCLTKGNADIGESCDNKSLFCKTGVCMSSSDSTDKTCHAFCVNNSDCGNGSPCNQVLIMYGKVKACGKQLAGCDIFSQDCPEKQGCYQMGNDFRCIQEGQKKEDEECIYANDCKKGLACVSINGKSSCHTVCSQNQDSNNFCEKLCPADYGYLDNAQIGFCYTKQAAQKCDIFKQDCTDNNHACYYTQDGFVCAPEGKLEKNATCQYANDCKKGLMCASNICLSVCDISSPLCDEGEECQAIVEQNNTGVCVKP